ncbi:MAG TPA: PqiC family protein [Thermoanaerobaculia bacterium]|nr:PqiC family protein [Thermoanaerobaculia bacterium]
MNALSCRPLLVFLGGCALAGCSTFSPRSDPSRFFFLTPYAAQDLPATSAAAAPGVPVAAAPASPGALTPFPAPPAATREGGPALAIGLAEIGFPAYLERPELATRIAPNELRFSTTARWAEPLGPSLTRVLAADLSARLGPQGVVRLPWYSTTRLDGVLAIEIEHFEPDRSSRTARLVAHWTLRDAHGQRVLRGGTSILERPLGAEDSAGDGKAPAHGAHHAAAVAALSLVLDDFSRDLALAVRQTVRPADR